MLIISITQGKHGRKIPSLNRAKMLRETKLKVSEVKALERSLKLMCGLSIKKKPFYAREKAEEE